MKTSPAHTLKQKGGGFTLVELLVVISIIVILAGIATPTAMRALAHAERLEAMTNVRSVKSALDIFASDFQGEYPNDNTAAQIGDLMRDDKPSRKLDSRKLDGGRKLQASRFGKPEERTHEIQHTSNEYFQQLMGRGLDNEQLLYNKAFRRAFKLNPINNDGKVDRGECVWGYTKNLMRTSSGHIPIVYDSPVSTGDSPGFSKTTWDGRIMVARLDGSTRTEPLGGTDRKTGSVRATIGGQRMNLFSQEALEEGELVPANLQRLGSGN
ncbi:MAG: type II secretion system protein [Roseibacillus sp.]